ncbi:methionine synthase [Arsenicicoccus piscis]|uniref:Cobalamin-independent methionine synthase MetE C-terminal/archaeal domain-containing protein n=1 Tax=Arsenicicoccus piscis TaxID=673954 RepID=A0ABQ6HPA5_9MICO|nr:methionine synthase [Arsenicicoccus piscis]MCH8628766.1 methionine synthase [Arsenicicoccus piscis]GMA20191.1 hypothetical protein GCM10025862_22120 [Arsenicicoccus piscis]
MTRATGMGSWPGTDVAQADRIIRDLLGDGGLPYVPELPDRGPGADMIGRAAGLLVDLPVDLQPIGWRLVDRPGRDAQRASAIRRQDLDLVAEVYDGYEGELKVQATGPWTLASGIWLPRGERVIVDEGATRDLVESLAEGIRGYAEEVERLVPDAQVVVQLDEPSLPSVLGGRLPTASGFGRIRAVDSFVAANALSATVKAVGERTTVIHCCAKGAPIPLLRTTGASALAVDTQVIGPKTWESVAVTVEDGLPVWLGVLPTTGEPPRVQRVVDELLARWEDLGVDPHLLDGLVVSPACGLAGQTWAGAVETHRRIVEVATELATRTAA